MIWYKYNINHGRHIKWQKITLSSDWYKIKVLCLCVCVWSTGHGKTFVWVWNAYLTWICYNHDRNERFHSMSAYKHKHTKLQHDHSVSIGHQVDFRWEIFVDSSCVEQTERKRIRFSRSFIYLYLDCRDKCIVRSKTILDMFILWWICVIVYATCIYRIDCGLIFIGFFNVCSLRLAIGDYLKTISSLSRHSFL